MASTSTGQKARKHASKHTVQIDMAGRSRPLAKRVSGLGAAAVRHAVLSLAPSDREAVRGVTVGVRRMVATGSTKVVALLRRTNVGDPSTACFAGMVNGKSATLCKHPRTSCAPKAKSAPRFNYGVTSYGQRMSTFSPSSYAGTAVGSAVRSAAPRSGGRKRSSGGRASAAVVCLPPSALSPQQMSLAQLPPAPSGGGRKSKKR